ncbi:aldose 1-epimerase [Aeromicrobium yanjiei]|uniref:Aldose 1-epimerase n=1 Tax=Aeromicrobium yanjiei TaxID=2662028 RepID=A0A5Q2MDU0_9ACTN|nr:aldose 1-epimerase [Aeromicrobium yanjiei]QGG41274.1 aldose 1-epimerase [Aeromicrobium yanjiei]
MTDVLENDRVRATIDPARGARLTSLVIDGHELLARAEDPSVDPAIADGCFAMVPWAGRVREGRLRTADGVHQLPVSDDGNALHGLGHVEVWDVVGEGRYRLGLGEPWPTTGTASLTYRLLDAGLRIELSWDDGTASPCSIGLHPWFPRRLPTGQEVVLSFDPETMVERGDDGLPTGRLVEPSPGPWDDCFRVAGSPVLSWPGAVRLRLSSSSPWWVVYSQPESTICVEPQTAPPDAFDHASLQPTGGWPHHLWFELDAAE